MAYYNNVELISVKSFHSQMSKNDAGSEVVVVQGIATDAGGEVAGVEVSIGERAEGDRRWHPAEVC